MLTGTLDILAETQPLPPWQRNAQTTQWTAVRIPDQKAHPFRSKWRADSGSKGAPVPG